MVLSYSKVAQPAPNTPSIISISKSATNSVQEPEFGVSLASLETEEKAQEPVDVETLSKLDTEGEPIHLHDKHQQTIINHLILDAGPLLSLTPLRHLATSFHTTPFVLAELRDPKAREHWERLGLTGVDVKVESPSAESMAKVVEFAKKTGDFAVLSSTDLSVAALTYQYEVLANGDRKIRTETKQDINGESREKDLDLNKKTEGRIVIDEREVSEAETEDKDDAAVKVLTALLDQAKLDDVESSESQIPPSCTPNILRPVPENSSSALVEDNEDDGGEWITPSNVNTHRSRDLGLITPSRSSAKPPAVACMTGDYAVQNILLGMGLGLVGEGGKKISKVKSWVLRCHACFKICKDSSKRFCPSCGNATLLRTTVSTSAKTGQQNVHLKQNFQYRTRGTIYSIPDPKMGRAKGQQKGGSGLILREDQREWQDALRGERIKKQKEEKRAARGALEGWNDPDWLPDIITVGMSGQEEKMRRFMLCPMERLHHVNFFLGTRFFALQGHFLHVYVSFSWHETNCHTRHGT
ncbi:hypothetical protein L204_103701 [Cryptococcus depauperatus]